MTTGLWKNISNGASLTLEVRGKTPSDKDFVGGARFVPDVGEDEMWKVTKGPIEKPIPGDMSATVRIGIRFESVSNQTVVVEATLRKADGSTHNDAKGNAVFTSELSGKQGEGMQRSTLVFWN